MEVGKFIGRMLQFHPVVPWSYILGLNFIIREINQTLPEVSLSFLFTFWKVKGGILHDIPHYELVKNKEVKSMDNQNFYKHPNLYSLETLVK